MPDDVETAGAPEEKGRSLAGFYIAVGIVAALVLLGAWLWTPVSIWYWERETRKACYEEAATISTSSFSKSLQAANRLVRIGPPAYSALGRLLADRAMPLRIRVLGATVDSRADWALPLVVKASGDPDGSIAEQALVTACYLAERDFITGQEGTLLSHIDKKRPDIVATGRQKLLTWWESEGRARYEARYGKVPE